MAIQTKIRYNERSWAIELISQINSIVSSNGLLIKRAGGESTISTGTGTSMFPDVILYGDTELTTILQGWELKMPDVRITDETFVKDAQRKANALHLNSCVIWNFTHAKLYVKNLDTNSFEEVRHWSHPEIQRREDVPLYKTKWQNTLKEVVLTVNEFLRDNRISNTSLEDFVSKDVINILINDNKDIVATHFKDCAARNSVIGAKISTWWKDVQIEYSFDEEDKYKAYSKSIILNWAYRIIFAHIIKKYQNPANLIKEIGYDTTPSEANSIFERITSQCDFYNIFAGLDFNDLLPTTTWKSLVDLSLFLGENGIAGINQDVLHNIFEKCINTTRRELNGQYTTPKILARILASITVHDWTADCADPCCGTGTIAHEIIEKKKENRLPINEIISTTWASDKYKMPLQIANINMISPETINLANRLFQSNALDLTPGLIVDIVDPENGTMVKYPIPLLGAICSNLPFVPFENIDAEDIISIGAELRNELDKRSDLSYFIALRLANMLKDDGYMGIITSNAWLGTSAGEIFYRALINRFDLLQVHISGAGRWFQNADVVTTILVLQKKQAGIDSLKTTSFYVWKKHLEEIEQNKNIEETIVNTSLISEVKDSNIIDASVYTREEINILRSYNLSYNALFHRVNWLLGIQNILTPLRSVFRIFRGSRRGWDDLFFPKGKNNIEPEFLLPALVNAKGVNTLIATPDRLAFSCSKTMDDLEENYPEAFAWVKKFETVTNGTNKPLPKVLKRAKEEWYEMQPNEVCELFTMMNPDKRIFFGRFINLSFINQRLIGLRLINPNLDIELCHALLNSILMKFFIEAVGFGRGLGVLDINKDSVSYCFMLNPELVSDEDAKNIKEQFSTIVKKEIVSVEEEMNDSDWINFNHTVLRVYGIENLYEQIKSSLCSLRKVRFTAKEKYSGPVFTIPSYYSKAAPPTLASIAAEPQIN